MEEVKNTKKQPERCRMGRFAWAEMRRDPPAVPQHRLLSGLAFFFGRARNRAGTSRRGGGAHNHGRKPMPPELADNYEGVFLWTVLLMTILGLLGWRWSYAWRAESMPAVLAMIWIPLPYVLGHAGALSGPRLPLDGVLLCYTAFALLCFVPRVRRHLLDGAKAVPPPPRATVPSAEAPRNA